jgi:hypothetical protein
VVAAATRDNDITDAPNHRTRTLRKLQGPRCRGGTCRVDGHTETKGPPRSVYDRVPICDGAASLLLVAVTRSRCNSSMRADRCEVVGSARPGHVSPTLLSLLCAGL